MASLISRSMTLKNWIVLGVTGLLFIGAGFFALLNPFAATVTVEMFTGWSFLVLGALQAIGAIREKEWAGKLWTLLLGVVALLIGISLISNPLAGVVTLTIILGVMFLTSGLFKLIVGFKFHARQLKWIFVTSGVISLAFGIVVILTLPGSALITLGLALAVEMLSNGLSAICLAWARKSEAASA